MAERKIDEKIITAVERFVAELSKHYRIEAAYLFGSFAKGTNHADSDIDVAVIASDITNTFDAMGKMWGYTWNFDTRIEPHPIRTEEFKKRETPFINEIISTGIPVYAV